LGKRDPRRRCAGERQLVAHLVHLEAIRPAPATRIPVSRALDHQESANKVDGGLRAAAPRAAECLRLRMSGAQGAADIAFDGKTPGSNARYWALSVWR
jgi:hypothetical protein